MSAPEEQIFSYERSETLQEQVERLRNSVRGVKGKDGRIYVRDGAETKALVENPKALREHRIAAAQKSRMVTGEDLSLRVTAAYSATPSRNEQTDMDATRVGYGPLMRNGRFFSIIGPEQKEIILKSLQSWSETTRAHAMAAERIDYHDTAKIMNV